MEKVISLYKAGTLIASYKERGKKSGIAVGTFNPVRPHHANALEEAKEFLQRHANGGILIVATNDKSTERLGHWTRIDTIVPKRRQANSIFSGRTEEMVRW